MVRRFVNVLRTLIVGPTLARLSQLGPNELNNLLMHTSIDFLKADARSSSGSLAPGDIEASLDILREQQSILREKIEVLERLKLNK